MPPEQLATLKTALKPRLTKYIPHLPHPKQQVGLLLDNLEVFWGGAAGGGKSDWLLMAALQYVDVPGYSALLLRRTYADLSLPGAIMDRAQEWLRGTDAHWYEQRKTWVFPSGATLTFGYLDSENDKFRYQGAELQFCGFDELTQFTETQYRYLFSRLRKLEGVQVPLRMRAASNPGGIGHDWVKRRFLEEGPAAGRIFIPAWLEDNPSVDAETYAGSLAELDPLTRAQLRDGDWSVREVGRKFQREWFEIVDVRPHGLRLVRFWDIAGTEPKPGKDPDWTRGCLLGVSREGVYYLCDMVGTQATAGQVEALIRQTAELDGKAVPIRMEQEPGSSGKAVIDNYLRRVLPGFDFRGVPSTGSKEVRANPVASQAYAGNVKLVRGPWINAFLEEAEMFPMPGYHDDQVDALSGAFHFLQAEPIEAGMTWAIPRR